MNKALPLWVVTGDTLAKIGERPYANSGVMELEKLFAHAGDDAVRLALLRDELEHRETDRAGRLLRKVMTALEIPTAIARPEAATPERSLTPGEAAGISADPARQEKTTTPAPAPSRAFPPPPQQKPVSTFPSSPEPKPGEAAEGLEASDLGRAAEVPLDKDQPAAILSSWIATEALTPQTFLRPEELVSGDARAVAKIRAGKLPWEIGETARPKTKLFYHVVLGTIDMSGATQMLVDSFGDDDERVRPERKKAAIASILVDRDGIPVPDGLSVSSFAWALPMTLKGRIGALGNWPSVEERVIGRLAAMFERLDPDGRPLPILRQQITNAHQWLVDTCDISRALVEAPEFALRVYHRARASAPPEALLLNSFFINDLIRAQTLFRDGKAPETLARYMGMAAKGQTFDLLADTSALEALVAPSLMPLAKWPAKGGHPLVLLQQAAVNAVDLDLKARADLIAVNGPPGTGKTTLLRDIISARILDRANAMVAFDLPEKAFTPTGPKVSAGEAAWYQAYKLADSLKGHEIVVASSNNKAVENVSKELPGLDAIGRDPKTLNYFKSISDLLFQRKAEEADDDEPADTARVETWGLVAAVLGNGRNRAAFTKRFWWDDELAFRLYLKAAKGDVLLREIKDETGKVIESRLPAIVDAEKPPAPDAARRNWKRTRAQFLSLRHEIETELADLEAFRQTIQKLPVLRTDADQAREQSDTAQQKLGELDAAMHAAADHVQQARLGYDHAVLDIQTHALDRPGFWSKFFKTRRWKTWSLEALNRQRAELKAREHQLSAEKNLMAARQSRHQFQPIAEVLQTACDTAREALDTVLALVERHQSEHGNNALDDGFFDNPHDTIQLTAPWLPQSLHRKREDLFVAALAVQRAFVDASAQKVLHNLSILFMEQSPPTDADRLALQGDLWATLFAIVPVVSTTFASVERMFSGLEPATLGWLLIDEAGQATPQAAVGAIMRTCRTVIVGDPLQIPPVVSLPERLVSELSAYFCVTKDLWAAPEASTQTLADRASRFISHFPSDQGQRRAGVPLLVHRRCQEPMFGISNAIAYDDQMVFAAGAAKPGPIGQALGPSHWRDVDGPAESKWCKAEGDALMAYLYRLAEAGIENPDIFIISPFRIVAQEARRRIEQEKPLLAAFGVSGFEWLKDRVGTIHTFQGREADTVFLVLGAPTAAQAGARKWAAGTPNILNVAVSRAKQNLYVVGSRKAWGGVGHAGVLAQDLPAQFAPAPSEA